MSTDREEWKPIPEFPDYSASTHGRIRSEARTITLSTGRRCRIRERILKLPLDDKGYPQVNLYREKVPHHFKVHRLLALTFHGEPPEDKPEVAHLDHDPTNNRPHNLVYADRIHNHMMSVDEGRLLAAHGIRRGSQKLSRIEAAEVISMLHQGHSQTAAAARFGIAISTVWAITVGKSWREHIMHEAVGDWITSMDQRIAEHRRAAFAERAAS